MQTQQLDGDPRLTAPACRGKQVSKFTGAFGPVIVALYLEKQSIILRYEKDSPRTSPRLLFRSTLCGAGAGCGGRTPPSPSPSLPSSSLQSVIGRVPNCFGLSGLLERLELLAHPLGVRSFVCVGRARPLGSKSTPHKSGAARHCEPQSSRMAHDRPVLQTEKAALLGISRDYSLESRK